MRELTRNEFDALSQRLNRLQTELDELEAEVAGIDVGGGAAVGSFGPMHQLGYGGIDATLQDVATQGRKVVEIQGGDDSSTRIGGFDATGLATGSILWVLNSSTGLGDAQSLFFTYEDTGSLANNRISTPDRRRYKVGGNSLVALMRGATLDGGGNPTADERWFVAGQCDFESVKTQDLQFYPALNVGTVTPISGVLNNWNPVGDPYQSYAHDLDGGDREFKNYALIRVGVAAEGVVIPGMFTGLDDSYTDLDKHGFKIILNFGPGDMTFRHLSGSSSASMQVSCPAADDFVLQSGEGAIFAHHTNWFVVSGPNSRIDARRVTVTSTDPAQDVVTVTGASGQINHLRALNAETGQVISGASQRGFYALLNGTYDCTTQNQSVYGILAQVTATKSAGPNSLTNVAIYGNATGGALNYAGLFDGAVRVTGDTALVGTYLEITSQSVFYNGVHFVSLNGPIITGGAGSPEGAVTAPVGSLYLRSDGGAGTTLYVKESGAGNTGWAAK